MLKDERDLLDVLKFELYFLSKGGYQQSSMEDWRPKFIFEDSPTCTNYHAQHNRGPCSACVLMNLVPFKRRFAQVPCRLIPVNSESETLDDLYRYSDQNEIEKTVERWLKDTIEHLEIQRAAAQSDHTTTNTSGESLIGTPLYQNLHPKCANPACPTAFHWTGGGKFFRFRPDPAVLAGNRPAADTPGEKVQPGSTSKESSMARNTTGCAKNAAGFLHSLKAKTIASSLIFSGPSFRTGLLQLLRYPTKSPRPPRQANDQPQCHVTSPPLRCNGVFKLQGLGWRCRRIPALYFGCARISAMR